MWTCCVYICVKLCIRICLLARYWNFGCQQCYSWFSTNFAYMKPWVLSFLNLPNPNHHPHWVFIFNLRSSHWLSLWILHLDCFVVGGHTRNIQVYFRLAQGSLLFMLWRPYVVTGIKYRSLCAKKYLTTDCTITLTPECCTFSFLKIFGHYQAFLPAYRIYSWGKWQGKW